MTSPTSQIVQMTYQNPQASDPLILPVLVVCNTSVDKLRENVKANAARDLLWVESLSPHQRKAVVVGGGGSITEDIGRISNLGDSSDTDVFALNGASTMLTQRGIDVDFQVLADAKQVTSQLVDLNAKNHLVASQVHPDTIAAITQDGKLPTLWHMEVGTKFGDIEDEFPPDRLAEGGYAIFGGGAASGNTSLHLIRALGYREIHIFGFDSSHRDGKSHAYDQPMNQFIPTVKVEWGGREFTSSVAMKAQAEKFQLTAQALKQAGCTLHVYGDGLLQTMYNTPPAHLSERDKYRRMWEFDEYRVKSPGELVVEKFLDLVKPSSLVLDIGCGTGRAGLAMSAAGLAVLLIDFADNCRDEEAMRLPFLEWDLSRPLPPRANYGFCADVMEHIPTADVGVVIGNIMESAETTFFQISTVPDDFGVVIGMPLHLTVKPHEWWMDIFARLGYKVSWSDTGPGVSMFLVHRS